MADYLACNVNSLNSYKKRTKIVQENMQENVQQAGALALVGAGEFLPVMNETDRFLLQTLKPNPRVVVIPTASGLEENGPQYWMDLGLKHFRALQVDVQAAPIVRRDDAAKPEVLEILQAADFYYFSGGNPVYLIETLQGTPAWEIIMRNYSSGAVMAGCSAGAMAMSGYTTNIRAAMGGRVEWVKAWGIVPNLITMPHFDRMAGFVGTDFMRQITQNVPENCRLIGVDENTALVRTNTANGGYQWQVMGSQTVSVFGANGERTLYHSGEIVAI